MSDVIAKPSNPLRSFVVRFLIGLAVVCALVALSFGGRFGAAMAYFTSATGHLHAPDFARVAEAPLAIKIHLTAALTAFALGLVQLAGVKGTTAHRALGWSWVVIMAITAVSSFFIRVVNHGSFSFIHLLSGWTVIALPMAVYAARKHNVMRHGRMMTGLFLGGLIVAGLLTFLPGRLMWRLFFG